MSWKDRSWKPPVYKLNEGPNGLLFLDEGEEVEGTYGPQVRFKIQPLDVVGKPVGDSGKLFISSGSLLETLRSYPRLTGISLFIIRTGTGNETTYEIKEKL